MLRSIPACAGEPSSVMWYRSCRRVYPRVCGGTSSVNRRNRFRLGLSPRVRGNRLGVDDLQPHAGSIPACAGEPRSGPGTPRPSRVYPRVCGGTTPRRAGGRRRRGLSPRVRGNQRSRPPGRRAPRSIPACAGEPPRWTWTSWRGKVYPRVCGGTSGGSGFSWDRTGLSPRVRGNPTLLAPVMGGVGSIPACAGEPPSAMTWNQVGTVYPRVCGGTASRLARNLTGSGLSPRVRGNPARA